MLAPQQISLDKYLGSFKGCPSALQEDPQSSFSETPVRAPEKPAIPPPSPPSPDLRITGVPKAISVCTPSPCACLQQWVVPATSAAAYRSSTSEEGDHDEQVLHKMEAFERGLLEATEAEPWLEKNPLHCPACGQVGCSTRTWGYFLVTARGNAALQKRRVRASRLGFLCRPSQPPPQPRAQPRRLPLTPGRRRSRHFLRDMQWEV
ncbi:uncharacterized protein LOC128898040 [Dryobates pubescens]|uniref:uncharacterized protein LOC128898040 n=1 Tax=Dryobates pubescens TaxID=118200 RepID=UPI0023B8CC49|nr:uncharacterized protein LOC128898040 [Dryobates pubescens]